LERDRPVEVEAAVDQRLAVEGDGALGGGRIDAIEDHIRAGQVCAEWRSSAVHSHGSPEMSNANVKTDPHKNATIPMKMNFV
jgi:hypothetical protein